MHVLLQSLFDKIEKSFIKKYWYFYTFFVDIGSAGVICE